MKILFLFYCAKILNLLTRKFKASRITRRSLPSLKARINVGWVLMVFATPICFAHAQFTLITVLYNESHDERIKEYLECFSKNAAHPQIETIHVVYDTSKDDANPQILQYLKSQNIKITFVQGRPTFGFLFTIANSLYDKSSVIISNADIYFNETLQLLDDYSLENKFLALTRWNVTKDGGLIPYVWPNGKNAEYSQDSWIFKTPIKSFFDDAIHLGVPHCDGRIAFEAQRAGILVLNPCLSLQCCHLHLSGKHNYTALPYPHGKAIKVGWSRL